MKSLLISLWKWLWPSPQPVQIQIQESKPKASKKQIYYKYEHFEDALFHLQEGKCFHCSKKMITFLEVKKLFKNKNDPRIHNHRDRATRDHIVTLHEQQRKGWHIPPNENIILACGRCNNKRQADSLTDDQVRKAFALNRKALITYATERTDNSEEIIERCIGKIKRPSDLREFRPFKVFPTSQWEYLFRDACRRTRRTRIVDHFDLDSSGAAAD